MTLKFSQKCFRDSWILVYFRFDSYFMFIAKGKLYFSLICSFYCCLVKGDWGLRGSRPEVFCKKGALRNLTKFTGKHLCMMFSCEFCEISKNTFLLRTPLVAASKVWKFERSECLYNMLLKNLFLLPHLFCNAEFEFSWFHSTKVSSEILILEIEMLLEFQNKTNIEMMGST